MALLAAGTLIISTPAVFMADDGTGAAETVQSTDIEETKEAAVVLEAEAAEPQKETPAEAPAEKPEEKPAEVSAAQPEEKPAEAPAAQPEAAPAAPAETPAEKPAEAPAETKAEETQPAASEEKQETAAPEEKQEAAPENASDEGAAETPAETESKQDAEPAESKDEASGNEAEKPAEEKKDEAAAESTAENAESKAEDAEKKDEKTEEKKVEQFTGSVKVERVGSGDIYEGDAVTLQASISGANRSDYTIQWQAKATSKWVTVAEGSATYTFAADEVQLGHTYRVVLKFAEDGVNDKASNELGLPAMKVKEEAKAKKSVTIATTGNEDTKAGDTVTLTSELIGFDDASGITYQWMCNKGSGYEEVPGANGPSYSFTADEESLNWTWQLSVRCAA